MAFASEKRITQIDMNALLPPIQSGTSSKPKNNLTASDKYPEKHSDEKTHPSRSAKRSLSPGEASVASARFKPPKLPVGIRYRASENGYLRTTHASPWKSYEKSYEIRLGVEDLFVVVAERTDTDSSNTTQKPYSNLGLVKKFSGPSVDDELRKLQQIQDPSIVSPIEIFRSDEACYVVYEYMSFSVYYITSSPQLDQIRLAAIIGQVRLTSLFSLVR